MKQLAFTSLLLCFCLAGRAQNPCTPVGSDRCINAPMINSCQLNGWYSNTDPPNLNYTDNDDIIDDPGWCNGGFSIENNQWLKFVAIEDHLYIDVDVSECEAGNGIQMGCYELGDETQCPGDQINCFGLASGANTSLVFEIDNLTPGQEYLLMIDGWAGDGCPFLLYITSGIPLALEVDASPLAICPGVQAEGALNAEITEGGGQNILYGWSTENGNIVSGEFTLNPIIDEPGDYTFFAYNLATCCWAAAEVNVPSTTETPLANAEVIQHIGCEYSTATLSAEGSEEDNGFNVYDYLWSFPNGNPAGEGMILEGLIYPGEYILTVLNVSTGCQSETMVEVFEDYSEPEIILQNPPILDCNNQEIFLAVDAPIGSTFEWSSIAGFSSNEQAPLVNETGFYSVTVTGANGCTSDQEIEVIDDIAIPLLQVQALTLDCNNPTSPINVINDNAETTYSWVGENFSSTEMSPIISSAGSYTLIATNPNGCSEEYMVVVIEDFSVPDIEIQNNEILDCNLTTITLASTSMSAIVDYQWSAPAGFVSDEATPDINAAGTYTLLVTDDKGCMNTTDIIVEENLLLPDATLVVDDVLSCANDNVEISSQSGQTIVSYEWSDNLGTESNATVESIGTYSVTITGENGCTDVRSIDVADNFIAPEADAGPDAMITCTQSQSTLNAGGNSLTGGTLSYQWIYNGNNLSTETNLSVSAVGTYQLLVTDTENGCTALDEVEITSDENIPEVVLEEIATLDCNTTTVLLSGINSTAGDNISYQWLDENDTPISYDVNIEVEAIGSYTFVVINEDNGCTAELPIQVEENFAIPAPLVEDIKILNCLQDKFTAEVINQNTEVTNISYQWFNLNDGITLSETNSLEIDATGNYTVLLTNMDNGCSIAYPFNVEENRDVPNANAGAPSTITCNDVVATLDGSSSQGENLTYAWYNESRELLSDEQVIDTRESGIYELIVTNTESGCTDISTVTIDINADFPEIRVTAPTVLNCTQMATGLYADSSIGTGTLTFAWYDENQNLISNEANIDVDVTGEYTLVLTDTDSDCSVEETLVVIDDFELPNVDPGPPQTITCDINSITLDGSNSDSGNNFYYQWYNANNVLLGNEEFVSVENPGIYTLVVSSISNGCSNSSTVTVTPDENIPEVEIANNGILSCLQSEVELFSALTPDPNYSYTWENENGTVVSNNTEFIADSPGVYTLYAIDNTNGCSNFMSIQVEDNFATPMIDLNIPDFINCTNDEVLLSATVSSNNQDVSFSWSSSGQSGFSNQAEISIMETGIYTLIATDNTSGCFQSLSTEVEDNFDILTPEIMVDNIIDCNTQFATLTEENINLANYTFAWYDQDDNLLSEDRDYTTDEPGMYDLIATNMDNGCTTTVQAEIIADLLEPSVVIPPVDVLNCKRESVILAAQTEQNPDYTYQWLDSLGTIVSTNPEIQISDAGEYQLVVTNTINGCRGQAVTMVNENINQPEAIIDDLAPLGLSCTQQSVLLDGLSSTPIGNVQYNWFDPVGNLVSEEPTYEATNSGNYTLIITDLTTFCESQINTLISQNEELPQVSIAPPNILTCNVGSVILDASQSDLGSEFVYAWDIPAGAINFDDSDILNPSTASAGTYTLTVSNTNTGCENQFSIDVSSDFIEPIAQANAGGVLDCVTAEVQLNADGSSQGAQYSQSWIIDGQALNNFDFVTVQNPGTYSLIVTDLNNGCTSEALVNVEENTDRPTGSEIVGNDITCFGDDDGSFQVNEIIGGAAPYSFVIANQTYSELPSLNDLGPGTYSLLVTDAIGCTLSTDIVIEEPPQVYVQLSEDITINLGESTYLSASSNVEEIVWSSEGDLECEEDCFLQQVSPYSTTVYEVLVYDENGCAAIDNVVVDVQFDRAVYIPNAFTPNGDGLNDFFRVFGNSSVLRVQNMLIVNRWGEVVFEEDDIALDQETDFWDGRHRGEMLNDNVLVYYVVVEYIDGLTESFKGDVTLIR